MLGVREGQRFRKRGDHRHIWVIDAIVQRKVRPGHYAILVSEDGNSEEEVDLALLADVNLYQPMQAGES